MRAASDSRDAIERTSTQGVAISQCEKGAHSVPGRQHLSDSLWLARRVVCQLRLQKGPSIRPKPEPTTPGDGQAVRGFIHCQTREEPQFGQVRCGPVFTFQLRQGIIESEQVLGNGIESRLDILQLPPLQS